LLVCFRLLLGRGVRYCPNARRGELMVVSRIALTRPEMSSRVEDLLVRMGQAGQIRGQVTDDQLKGLLQQVS
jgi:DNA-binding TFAR19-related protein (PDSD5 family)